MEINELMWVRLDGESQRRLAGFLSVSGGIFTVQIGKKKYDVGSSQVWSIYPTQQYDDNPAPFGIYLKDYRPEDDKLRYEAERKANEKWANDRFYRGFEIELEYMSDGGAPGTAMYQATATNGDVTLYAEADNSSWNAQYDGIVDAIDKHEDGSDFSV